jgi:hypothetical protein
MNKVLSVLLFVCLMVVSAFSQDMIVTLKNDSILSRIYGVDSVGITYRPIDFLDGPVRVMSRNEVYLIKYEDGTIDSINTAVDITLPYDLIVMVNRDSIIAKVIEISSDEIKYRDITFFDGPLRVLSRDDVYLIRYANGQTEIINDSTAGLSHDAHSSAYDRGVEDAIENYHGSTGAATITIITALILPPLGLIPAIACSSTPPNENHLNYPSSSKMKKEKYREGYTTQAWKIKKNRVWTSFAIGSGIWLAIVLLPL